MDDSRGLFNLELPGIEPSEPGNQWMTHSLTFPDWDPPICLRAHKILGILGMFTISNPPIIYMGSPSFSELGLSGF